MSGKKEDKSLQDMQMQREQETTLTAGERMLSNVHQVRGNEDTAALLGERLRNVLDILDEAIAIVDASTLATSDSSGNGGR